MIRTSRLVSAFACLSLVATLAACGAEESTSTSSTLEAATERAPDLTATFKKVVGADASIESVATVREHGKKVTKVSLGFPMGCLDKLGDVGTDATIKGGKVTLRVSGHALVSQQADRVRCMVANYGKHTVTLKGSFKKADITLVNLEDGVAAQESDTGLLAQGDKFLSKADASGVRVLSAFPICPPNPNGMSCMAVGSHVQLEVMLGGCLDRLVGYSTVFEATRGATTHLYVKALIVHNAASDLARCFAAPKATLDLFTMSRVMSPNDLVVHVL